MFYCPMYRLLFISTTRIKLLFHVTGRNVLYQNNNVIHPCQSAFRLVLGTLEETLIPSPA